MQVLHVVLSGRLEIDEHRYPSSKRIETVQIDADAASSGNRGYMDQRVGRPAYRMQYGERIGERLG